MVYEMNPASNYSSISYHNGDDFYHPIAHRRFCECHTSYQPRSNNDQTEARQSNEYKIP
jgi:hypothetical protein